MNLLDLGNFFNSQNLYYLQYKIMLLCINYHTFHIHTSPSIFIRSADVLLTSESLPMFAAEGVYRYFLKIT